MQAHGRPLRTAIAALVALTAVAPSAWAQAPAAAPPPAAAPYPYPYPYPPPYGAYPPPAYYAPPPGAAPAAAPAAKPEPPGVISPWDPDQPPPEGYFLKSKVNGGLIGGGIALLTSFWAASLIGGVVAAKDEEQAGIDGDGVEAEDWSMLYVPVVGPFVAIDAVGATSEGSAILVVDGVLQTFGAAMIVWGIFDQKYRVVRGAASRDIEVAPIAGGSMQGVSVRGSF